ncbi:hypothetical protein D3C80_1480720 [compost metagenome]
MRFGTRERFITDHRLADMVLPLPVSAGSTDMAMISARAASGTCTQNMARQPASGIRSPPSDGPSAVPSAETVPSRPIARPTRSSFAVWRISAIGSVIRKAAPTP